MVVLFFVFFEILAAVGVALNKKKDVSDYLAIETKDTQIHTKMAIIQMSNIAKIFFDKGVNTPQTKEIMYAASHSKDTKELARLRDRLYVLLQENYSYFQHYGVRQLHFHLPKAISFLRFHKPDRYGDSLWNARESIRYVNENLVPISCYEEGRIFNGFRNVFPLFYKNEFVGTVEISYSFLALQRTLLSIDSSSYLFLVSKKVADEKLFKSEHSHYTQSEFRDFLYDKATLQDVMELRLAKIYALNKKIAPEVQDRLQKGESFAVYFFDEDIYNEREIVVTFLAVKNLDAKTVAYIVHYKFDTFLELLLGKTRALFGVLTFVILLISFMLMAYLFYIKKKQKSIEDQATHDALTKIYNRYGINRVLSNKIYEYKRYQETFSIIFFDIDYFKNVNDTYGHDIGDFVLQNIAKIVSNNIRESDIFGRWGGEEFIVILPKTPLNEAVRVANKLRKSIESEHFGIEQKITCSFGVTEVREGDTASTLLKRADEYLYIAKESGRNCVVSDESVNNKLN